MASGTGKKLTVLHVIDSGGFGGGERYISDLVRYASPDISHMVVIPGPGALQKMLEAIGCPYAAVDLSRRLSMASIGRISRLIRRCRADIVHSHGYRSNLYGRLAARVTGKSHVCTVHVSLYDYIDIPGLQQMAYRTVEKLTSPLSRRFICISNAMAADIQRMGIPGEKIALIPNGVDLIRFYPGRRSGTRIQALGLPEKGPVIGTVGRMVPEKGQIHLIDSLGRLKGRFPDIVCLIIGEGALMEDLKRHAQETGVSDICIFGGVHANMEEIYPLFDIFVLPSLREPFGLVLLEAMASGVPVIASAAGGPQDFIAPGQNGVLVPPADPDALAGAIETLLKHPERRKHLASAGRDTVLQRFDIQRTVFQIETVYRSVLH